MSRELYENAVGYRDDCLKQAREETAHAWAQYRDLLEKFTALRVQGAVPEIKPTPEQVQRLALQEPDELRDLIHERYAGKPRLLGQALAQLKRDRLDGKSDEKILAEIEGGIESDGVPA